MAKFWVTAHDLINTTVCKAQTGGQIEDQVQKRMNEVEEFADFLISTNPDDIKCDLHLMNLNGVSECEKC